MIEVQALCKSFDGKEVLKNLDLSVAAGELVVVLGASGSGKSVFLQHLIGLMRPDSGRVVVNGQDLSALSERKLLTARRNMGYLFQAGALFDFMTVFENVAFPLVEHTPLKKREIADKVEEILADVGLREAIGKLPEELSGGMRKRAALARAVVLDSQVLYCDEPTSGLDPRKSREISDLIAQVVKKKNCTTVITSHDMANAFRIADRIVIIHAGRVAVDGTPQEIRDSQDQIVKEFLI